MKHVSRISIYIIFVLQSSTAIGQDLLKPIWA
jgi:hypothetical protein